jgi:hypothetical protein
MASGCVLNEASICQLGNCIQKVTGLASNSASPSDTWLLEFKPGTIYIDSGGKSIEIPRAFCKIFIQPDSFEQWLENMRATNEMASLYKIRFITLQGLSYELRFSEFVQNTIIDGKKSPHFIRTFATGDSCEIKDVIQTLEKGGISFSTASFGRNMYYSLNLNPTRPSISDPTIPSWPKNWDEFRFSFLLTQQIDNTTRTVYDWIRNSQTRPHFLSELFLILFQVCQACYALYSEEACHNDLHDGNVWLTIRPEIKKNVKYVINSKNYVFPGISILVRIFDFDRSYAESLGPNMLLESSVCPKEGQCNNVVEPKDFIKFLCYVVRKIADPVYKQIIKSILVKEDDPNEYENVFKALETLLCFPSPQVISDAKFREFPSYPILLDNIYRGWSRYSGVGEIPEDIRIDELFVLTPLLEEEASSVLSYEYEPEFDSDIERQPEGERTPSTRNSMPPLSGVKTAPL